MTQSDFIDTLTKDGEAYLIATAKDLCNLSDYVNAGNSCKGMTFKLANDIDLKSVENFTPIGKKDCNFIGTFDGGGHTISNLTITSDKDYVGLFGYVSGDGKIKNITLINAKVSGNANVGGLVGYNEGEIENCTASVKENATT